VKLRVAFCCNLIMATAVPLFSQQIQLTPRVKAGQNIVYRIEVHSSRSTKTESQVATPQSPADLSLDASGLLQVTIVAVEPSGLRLKTYLSEKPSSLSLQDPSPSNRLPETVQDKLVEVHLSADGSASETKGLDQLSNAQQFAWKTWLAQFASSMTFPKTGISVGQRWQSVDPETAASPISQLSWVKKSQYVRDEICESTTGAASKAGSVRSTIEKCVVVLVQAKLRQQSSPDKATPPDFKLRQMVTRGTATGANQTILYISRESGLLVRSTEDAEQAMDATVSLADGTNYVRYLIHAKSRSLVELLSN